MNLGIGWTLVSKKAKTSQAIINIVTIKIAGKSSLTYQIFF